MLTKANKSNRYGYRYGYGYGYGYGRGYGYCDLAYAKHACACPPPTLSLYSLLEKYYVPAVMQGRTIH